MNNFLGTRDERLNKLRALMHNTVAEQVRPTILKGDINNHIHTFYSFSPYSPSEAVWKAYQSGLATAGIMDHDSVAGAREFIQACEITGIAATVGIECRADFSNTPLAGRRINNPDQNSIAYIALHGIPQTQLDAVQDYFEPYRGYRNIRNRAITDRIHTMISQFGITLDFERDVVPLSKYHEGGSITERHILFALALKLIDRFGQGQGLINFLANGMKISVPPRLRNYLTDTSNIHYTYDLLGLLKSELLPEFYIDASEECPDIHDLVSFGKSMGAITAYAYLGDVENSVTEDKKAQKFEDNYLELLFRSLKELSFDAVTYMPSRNSIQQLQRIQALCEENDFFQISGEDINSSRQSFICEAMRDNSFSHLKDAAWALIGHDISATLDIKKGMFSPDSLQLYPRLRDRVDFYKNIGRKKAEGGKIYVGSGKTK